MPFPPPVFICCCSGLMLGPWHDAATVQYDPHSGCLLTRFSRAFSRLLAPSRAFVTPSHALSRLLRYDPHSGYLRRPEACNQRVHVSWGNYQVSLL